MALHMRILLSPFLINNVFSLYFYLHSVVLSILSVVLHVLSVVLLLRRFVVN